MTSATASSAWPSGRTGPAAFVSRLPPPPLSPVQPLLAHIVSAVARRHPDLFDRLGDAGRKRFLIDPTNLPVVLLLEPDRDRPRLRAHRRDNAVGHDVRIAGSFLTLLRMIDSQTDSDALFFSRDLSVTGDTEAMVALRNALDDMDTTLADDVAAAFGPLSRPLRRLIDLATRFKGTPP